MATITAVVGTVQSNFPAGTVSGKMRFSLQGADLTVAPVSQDVDDVKATFSDVADGTYTVTAQRLDQYSAPLGDAVISTPVIVLASATAPAANSVSVDVPQAGTLNVTVS